MGINKNKIFILTIFMVLLLTFSISVQAEFEMVNVPAGTSSDYLEEEDIELAYDLEIANYIITNNQFVEFLNDAEISADGSFEDEKLIHMDTVYCQIAHDGEEFHVKEWTDSEGEEINIGQYPVLAVTWYGAVAYTNWLSEKDGLTPAYDLNSWELKDEPEEVEGYRLPTSEEWIYAARGGEEGEETVYAGSAELDEVGWYQDNSDQPGNADLRDSKGTMPVGEKEPNELGIYDMSGNVWEWTNTADGFYRVLLGGSWHGFDFLCEVGYEYNYAKYNSSFNISFRPVRTVF